MLPSRASTTWSSWASRQRPPNNSRHRRLPSSPTPHSKVNLKQKLEPEYFSISRSEVALKSYHQILTEHIEWVLRNLDHSYQCLSIIGDLKQSFLLLSSHRSSYVATHLHRICVCFLASSAVPIKIHVCLELVFRDPCVVCIVKVNARKTKYFMTGMDVRPSPPLTDGHETGAVAQQSKAVEISEQKAEPECATSNPQEVCRSPICRLPIEILMDTFLMVLPNTFVRPLKTSAPLLLMQICSSWRAIVLLMPQMWSSLHVTMRKGISKSVACNIVELVNVWLRRSRGCSLSLSLSVCPDIYRPIGGAFKRAALEVVASFLRHAPRWKHVQLLIKGSKVFTKRIPFEVPSGVTAPMLENLDIRVSEPEHHNIWEPLNVILNSAPRLHHFSFIIDIGIWNQKTSIIRPPYSSLTHLDFSSFYSFHDVINILRLSEQLVECNLHLGFHLEGSAKDSSLTNVIHLNLQSLYIHTEFGLSGVLDHLILPALRCLFVMAGDIFEFNHPTWSQSDLTSFLTRSSCSLEELMLDNLALSESALIECLEQTPSLTNIIIHNDSDICLGDTILSRLSCHDGQTPSLCPRLDNMEFTYCDSFSDGAFADMIYSRISTSGANQPARVVRPKVVTVDLIGVTKQHMSDIRRLQPLRDEGIIVDIR